MRESRSTPTSFLKTSRVGSKFVLRAVCGTTSLTRASQLGHEHIEALLEPAGSRGLFGTGLMRPQIGIRTRAGPILPESMPLQGRGNHDAIGLAWSVAIYLEFSAPITRRRLACW